LGVVSITPILAIEWLATPNIFLLIFFLIKEVIF